MKRLVLGVLLGMAIGWGLGSLQIGGFRGLAAPVADDVAVLRIEGHVYYDLNQNDRLEPGEWGIGGVKVRIRSNGWSAETVSGENGFYDFVVTPGRYLITWGLLPGHTATGPTTLDVKVEGEDGTTVAGIDFGMVASGEVAPTATPTPIGCP